MPIEDAENESQETVDITPDKTLMEKMGSVGFTPELCFAEYVDNSLDARVDEDSGETLIDDKITIKILIDKDRILFEDNSSGIKYPKRFLRLADTGKKYMLGAFGLGIKTASMSLARRVKIISKRIKNEYGFSCVFDLDDWYTNKDWIINIDYFKDKLDEHYTKIILEKLYVDTTLYDVENIRKDLGSRFSEFIKNNEIEIILNSQSIIPEEIEFISKTEFSDIIKELGYSKDDYPESRLDFKFKIDNIEISGWVDILSKWSVSGRYGFNIYRGKRLINPHQKVCGILNNPRHSRIYGHLYLPIEFPVKFTKDGIDFSKRIWFEVNEKVKERIKSQLSLSDKMSQKRRFQQLKPQTLKGVNDYLEKIEKATKENKVIQDLLKPTEEEIRSKEEESTGKKVIDAEKRSSKIHQSFKKPIPKGQSIRQPGSKRQKKKSFYVIVKDKRIKLTHDFQSIDESPIQMYYPYFDEDNNELQIVTNTYFDSWGITNDESFYAAMNIITGLSEFLYYQIENPKITIKEIREEIWKSVGKIAYKSV